MGLLKELREATPLAEALAAAVIDAADGLGKAAVAASTIQLPAPPAPAGRATLGSAPAPASSSEGAAGGGMLIAPPRQIRSVDRKLIKAEDWLNAKCERTTFKIPNPRNPNAAAQGDMVTVGGWDCSAELHMEANFYDPDDMAKLRGDKTSSTRSGGGSGNQGPDPRFVIPDTRTVFAGGDGIVGDGSTSAGGPSRPSGPVQVTDPAMAEQTRLLREIRDQGRQDAGLGRRVGGRP